MWQARTQPMIRVAALARSRSLFGRSLQCCRKSLRTEKNLLACCPLSSHFTEHLDNGQRYTAAMHPFCLIDQQGRKKRDSSACHRSASRVIHEVLIALCFGADWLLIFFFANYQSASWRPGTGFVFGMSESPTQWLNEYNACQYVPSSGRREAAKPTRLWRLDEEGAQGRVGRAQIETSTNPRHAS